METALVATETRALASSLPGAEDIKILQQQYKRAVDGLYEAYLFGVMLLKVKATLEDLKKDPSTGDAHCVTAREMTQRNDENFCGDTRVTAKNGENRGGLVAKSGEIRGGWNAGTGLKGWLAQHCPEIHYRTALRFMEVAAKTHSGMRVALHASPEEAEVRAWLSGKSQRDVLRLGGQREGAGRKAKDYAAALGTDPAVAWKEIEGPLQALSELLVVHRRYTVLTEVDRQTLKDALQLMLQALEA